MFNTREPFILLTESKAILLKKAIREMKLIMLTDGIRRLVTEHPELWACLCEFEDIVRPSESE